MGDQQDKDSEFYARFAHPLRQRAVRQFKSPEGWDLLLSGVLEPPVFFGERPPSAVLWNLGIFGPDDLYDCDVSYIMHTFACDMTTAANLKTACHKFSHLLTRKDVLQKCLMPLVVSTVAASASQTDTEKNHHPETVELWETLEEDVLHFHDSLADTDAYFPELDFISSKAPAGEHPYCKAFYTSVCEAINRLIRYAHKKEGQLKYQWQEQARPTTLTDSVEMKKKEEKKKEGNEEEKKKEENKEIADLAQAQAVGDKGVPDITLILDGVSKVQASFVEMKRGERLRCISPPSPDAVKYVIRHSGTEHQTIYAPDVVAIWNLRGPALSKAVRDKVVGVIGQVTRYASVRGIRFAMFGNFWFLWVVMFCGNKVKISRAFPLDSTKPTIMQIVYYITCKAIKAAHEGLTPWDAKKEYSPPQPPPDSDMSSEESEGKGSAKGESSQGPAHGPANGGNQSRSSSRRSASGVGKDAKRSNHKAACETCERAAYVQHVLDQASPLHDALAAAATGINLNNEEAVVGCGLTGMVFAYRLASDLAALKVAPLHSHEGYSLAHEGRIYTALRSLWDVVVPRLLADGPGNNEKSYMLATRLISGRHISPKTDALYCTSRYHDPTTYRAPSHHILCPISCSILTTSVQSHAN